MEGAATLDAAARRAPRRGARRADRLRRSVRRKSRLSLRFPDRRAALRAGTERVRFEAGTSGTEVTDRHGPGTSVTCLLGAREGQILYFRLAADGDDLSWLIFNLFMGSEGFL